MPEKEKARYMRLDEVAHHLGYKDKASVYPLLTSHGGPIAVIATGPRRGLRVVRASFDAYCEAKEREAAQRFSRSPLPQDGAA